MSKSGPQDFKEVSFFAIRWKILLDIFIRAKILNCEYDHIQSLINKLPHPPRAPWQTNPYVISEAAFQALLHLERKRKLPTTWGY